MVSRPHNAHLYDWYDFSEEFLSKQCTALVPVPHNGSYPFAFFEHEARRLLGRPADNLARMLAAFQHHWEDSAFGGFVQPYLKHPQPEYNHYGLVFDMQAYSRDDRTHYGQKFRNTYFDGLFNFCMTYEDRLQAYLGFDVYRGRMFITQIQGVQGKEIRLRPVRWERALLAYALRWAMQQDIPVVTVQSVQNNLWARKEGHLQYARGKLRYDVTAQRCGFHLDSEGNYTITRAVASPVPQDHKKAR